jgi:acyl-CoA reductase-like NAD-dependent aldehyde dehydrogenase
MLAHNAGQLEHRHLRLAKHRQQLGVGVDGALVGRVLQALRLDFFLAQTQAAKATQTVFSEGGMIEQIEHMPLGVVANISAWNYPWFVGGNVFIPAVRATGKHLRCFQTSVTAWN